MKGLTIITATAALALMPQAAVAKKPLKAKDRGAKVERTAKAGDSAQQRCRDERKALGAAPFAAKYGKPRTKGSAKAKAKAARAAFGRCVSQTAKLIREEREAREEQEEAEAEKQEALELQEEEEAMKLEEAEEEALRREDEAEADKHDATPLPHGGKHGAHDAPGGKHWGDDEDDDEGYEDQPADEDAPVGAPSPDDA